MMGCDGGTSGSGGGDDNHDDDDAPLSRWGDVGKEATDGGGGAFVIPRKTYGSNSGSNSNGSHYPGRSRYGLDSSDGGRSGLTSFSTPDLKQAANAATASRERERRTEQRWRQQRQKQRQVLYDFVFFSEG